jgi:hypothetical protein
LVTQFLKNVMKFNKINWLIKKIIKFVD